MVRALTMMSLMACASVAAAQEAPPAVGPGDINTGANFVGSIPNRDLPTAGAGLLMPKSNSDVSVVGNQTLKSGDKRIAAIAAQRRADAVKLAQIVGKGTAVPADYAPKLREAIDGDMELWRDEFRVPSKSFKEAKRQWLDGMGSMDASALALLRAELFTARDAFNAATKRQ